MRKWIMIVAMVLIPSICLGVNLNLVATWTANIEPDMKEYKLYRTDGTRTLIGTISHPTTIYNFSVTVPDNTDTTLTFVVTAVDTANNESGDSNTAPFFSNLKAPAVPGGLGIIKP